MMKTIWEYSVKTEAQRAIHVAHSVANGFYRLNNFIVLPYDGKRHTDNIVTLPSLPYLSIPRFWNQAARIDTKTIPLYSPSRLLPRTITLFKDAHLPEPDITQLQAIWTQHEKSVLSQIYQLMPSKKNWVKNLVIWPTNFGTGCSFNLLSKPGPVYVWLRFDSPLSAIVEAILTSLTRLDVYQNLHGLWGESEMIVDWLLSYSSLSTTLNKIDPQLHHTLTIKSTRTKQNATLVEKSNQFLATIGAPVVSPRSINTAAFTPREKQVYDLLLSYSPRPASFDALGDLLFATDPDGYSLEAIAKTIQRLRDKLERNGISASYIQTKRKEGYLLVS